MNTKSVSSSSRKLLGKCLCGAVQVSIADEFLYAGYCIAYDDSDGWYDHVMSPIVNQSQTKYDVLTGPNSAGSNSPLGGFQARAGYGPRLPVLVISPFAKKNFVDHTITDQSSILRFIEDNRKLGRIGNSSFDALPGSLVNMFDFDNRDERDCRLFLDANTGEPYGF